jgi:hypothetical protein
MASWTERGQTLRKVGCYVLRGIGGQHASIPQVRLPRLVSMAAIHSNEADPSWRARVSSDSEPGEKLVISGKVLRTAGGPPASGTVISMYQTDAKGIYSTEQGPPVKVASFVADLSQVLRDNTRSSRSNPGTIQEVELQPTSMSALWRVRPSVRFSSSSLRETGS